MRTRRFASVLVSLAVFAVGLIAYAGSAAADPPPCAPGTSTTDNKSCVNFQVLPNNPGGTFTDSSLFFRTHTNFAHPGVVAQGGRLKTLRLDFDTDFRINPGTIPTCQLEDVYHGSTTIAQAWERCGPGADGPGEVNAYLSNGLGPNVSGRVSTVPASNFPGCSLVFHGPTANQVILWWRIATVPNGTADCSNPATNTFGNLTWAFPGTIGDSPVAGFGKRLTVPNLDLVNFPLDDFTAKLKRGNYFQAKCTVSPWKVLGSFVYSGVEQPADWWTATQPCS